jgi:hypothetical protein
MDEKNLGRGLYFVFTITFLDFLLEVYYGYAFNSLALLSDAVYMFMDLSGQALAIFAMYLSKKPPNPKRTFEKRGKKEEIRKKERERKEGKEQNKSKKENKKEKKRK